MESSTLQVSEHHVGKYFNSEKDPVTHGKLRKKLQLIDSPKRNSSVSHLYQNKERDNFDNTNFITIRPKILDIIKNKDNSCFSAR